MKSKETEEELQDGEIEPFQISYTKFTDHGTKDHIIGKLLDLKKTLNDFYRIAHNIKNVD